MSNAPLLKLQSVNFAKIRARVEAPPSLAPMLEACDSVPAALDLLMEQNLMQESIRLLAHGICSTPAMIWHVGG